VLVTSREPLHIDGEWEVAVDPMRELEAADLFVQRARAVNSEFEAHGEVANICRHLDCLPLAIELAAARVKALSPAILLERLEQRLPLLTGGSRSAPERQRTLRATIAWSYDLLNSAEQDLFARLAVFVGGGTLEAAEAICGADVDTVASVVDKSLVRRTGDRYWMLETIREFAAERIDELADAAELRTAHATWYIEFAERAQPELRAREARSWLQRLDSEHANLRAALDHLLESGDADGALRLSGALWPYWQTRGNWTEGRRYLSAAVALGVDLEPERLVDSLWGGSILALWQGDIDEGERLALRLLGISKPSDDHKRGYTVAIHLLAIVAARRGDYVEARPLHDELLELCRNGGEPWLLSIALNNLGNLLMEEGDYEYAIELFEESLAVGEARGDLDRRARANQNLGEATYAIGDPDRAKEFFCRSLEAATEIGLIECQLWALTGLAAVEADTGNSRTSAHLFGHAMELASRLGAAHDESELMERQTLARLEAALGPDVLASELAAGAALSLEGAIALALARAGASPALPD
jgi:tetratricopeptide (TPR) repeat protein